MDIDAMQQPSLEAQIDDDLINYDSDAADYSLAADQDVGSGPLPETLQEPYANAEPTNQSGDTKTEAAPANHATDNAADVDDGNEENADVQHDIEHAAEAELPLDADAAGAALDALTGTVADEIDYGLGEVDYNGEQNTEVAHEEEHVEVAQEDVETEGVHGLEEKAEISWEDDAADHGVTELGKDEHEAEEQPFVQTETVQLGDLAEQADVEADETESRDHRQDELQTLENAATWDASIDAMGDFQTENIDPHFPSITVQYQGDEFPFLASGSDGFFSDSSILDDSMQTIFSGFRSQLKNEVTADDELVFQIDELGLEFTETNPSFSLTMHQILEVFELLIKNDDPDGRRTLYTYLFTRVNSARRYDSLVESATSGKGLEEVQHLFSQQSFRHDSDADNADDSAVSSEHAEDHSEEYGGEHLGEHGERDDYQDEHNEEHGDEYHEEPADDHDEVEYFEEAIALESEESQADDSGSAIADQSENVDADEHDNSFAHEHSSTTSTLQGDADGTALADDETAVDAEADGPVFVTEADEDAEIDWRDEDESELVADGGSVTGKRSRDDDGEPDVDDEIDFKRRRS